MTKRIISLLCTAALLLSIAPVACGLEGESAQAADVLYTLGLMQGNSSGYALDNPVTRNQLSVLLVRLSGEETAAQNSTWRSGLGGIPQWAKSSVEYALYRNWITADTDTFNGDAAVSAEEACGVLLRVLGYSETDEDFSGDGALSFARRIGLTSRTYDEPFTRGDFFQMLRDALTFSYKDSEETVIDHLINAGAVSESVANALNLRTLKLTARQVADRLTAAVFQLDVYKDQDAIDEEKPSSNSSGFFITADGIAVTCYHCIEESIYGVVTLVSGDQYEVARVLYYDVGIDVAIIQISNISLNGELSSRFAYLPVVGTGDIRSGDIVYTLGNPLGLGLAVSNGIISDIARDVEMYTLPCIMNTADISQGSSGGALLNEYGQVIGITSGAYVYGNNMYLAVPVDPVISADLSGEGWTLPEVKAIEDERLQEDEEPVVEEEPEDLGEAA